MSNSSGPTSAADTASSRPASERIVYQGEPGANSHLACREAFPDMEAVACPTFEDALQAVKAGEARLAMIPIENSVAGRVADIHHLLPDSGLFIVAEHFERIRHQLLTLPGVKLGELKTVHSHTMALGQCRRAIRELKLKPVVAADKIAVSAPVQSRDGLNRRVRIHNNTGWTMTHFYASDSRVTSWEEDMLGSSVLGAGNSIMMNIDDGSGACLYDFKARVSSGRTRRMSASSTSKAVCRLSRAPPADGRIA